MPPHRFYPDAAKDDADLNRMLQQFSGFRIGDDPGSDQSSSSRLVIVPASPASHPRNNGPAKVTASPHSSSASSHVGSTRKANTAAESDDDLYWANDGNEDDSFWEEASILADQANDVAQESSDREHIGNAPALPYQVDDRDYFVGVGNEAGLVRSWHSAGHLSQGRRGGKVRLVTIDTSHQLSGSTNAAWVVYEGLRPGIYTTWAEAKAQTNRVPKNVHQGFPSLIEAERAYILAYALGCVVVRQKKGSTSPPLAPSVPTSQELLEAFIQADENFLGAAWHVVFKGKCPGVYPAWNFVATQTQGVSCAIYQKYSSRNAARAAFNKAMINRETEILY